MNKIYYFFLTILFFCNASDIQSQNVRRYTFDEVILIARQQSPRAVLARHRFRGSYWAYRTYRANLLPTLELNTEIPNLDRSYVKNYEGDQFIERNQISSYGGLSLNQNIGQTGGSVRVRSNLERIDVLGPGGEASYLSNPIRIDLNQPINGYNEFKWQREIAPLKYDAAMSSYVQALEDVSLMAVNYFFDLALAQRNLEIAQVNYSNSDTLYQIAGGRYQLGTIAENELLQMELAWLNSGTELNKATIDLEIKRFQLNSFLGLRQDEKIELIIPDYIPEMEISLDEALEKARTNNPDIIDRKISLLEADESVDQSKSQKGLNATLYASFGLSQRGDDFKGAYMDPKEQEIVSLGMRVPIMDWGLGRGKLRMAESAREVVKANIQQAEVDFQQEVILEVMQFNLQDEQLLIAAKADTIGQNRFHVSKERFLIGRISVLDLNVAQTEKDVAARGYLSALRNYWNYYFKLRSLTLYDWVREEPLKEDFEELLR